MDISTTINKINSYKSQLPIEKAHLEVAPLRENKLSLLDNKRIKYSAVLLLLFPFKSEIATVLIHRTKYNGAHSNEISLPGGKYEKSDINYRQTAIRETKEELGIPPKDIHIIRPLSNIYIPVSNFQITPFIGYMNATPEIIPQEREVADYFALPLKELMKVNSIQKRKVQASKQSIMKVPCFVFENHIIWGATAMILNEFRYLIR